jgi:predicted small metal-binding protein
MADRIVSIRCPCGFEVRSPHEAEVIRVARAHASEIHGQELTEEQARALIEVAA